MGVEPLVSVTTPSMVSVVVVEVETGLLEVLDEGDDESALREENARHPLDDGYGLIGECEFEIGFCDDACRVEFFQGFGDALGLRTRKASLFKFLYDAVGIDNECLHTSSEYHSSLLPQAAEPVFPFGRLLCVVLPLVVAQLLSVCGGGC